MQVFSERHIPSSPPPPVAAIRPANRISIPPFLGVYFGWRDLGFNLIRLPVAWGHIQDGCNGPLNGTTLAGLDNLVNTITGNGSTVISDIHSYARYYCAVIGQTLLNLPGAPQKVTDDHFVNLWMKLASHYKDKT
ncbi:glycoside hydrolase superfamily [Aspergillus alliaceus]|uniref:cellulase n=1 Tax=Petromyces alliaceus TaxID=209559 RepID=A0A5N7BSS9_PETAA|nr:glycoside hydrolase superfamily [Aspergillus alliaceus]